MKLLRMIYLGWGFLCTLLIVNPAYCHILDRVTRQTSVRDSSNPQDSQ